MYTNDVVEGSYMVKCLQNMIDGLGEFWDKWGLQINLSKTQIMMFRRACIVKNYNKFF